MSGKGKTKSSVDSEMVEEQLREMSALFTASLGDMTTRLDEMQKSSLEMAEKQNHLESKLEGWGTGAIGGNVQQGIAEDIGELQRSADEIAKKRTGKRTSGKSYLTAEHDSYAHDVVSGDQSIDSVQKTNAVDFVRYIQYLCNALGKHSGEEKDHQQWMSSLISSFRVCGFPEIVSKQETVWQQLRQADIARAMNQDRVMVAVLLATVKTGSVYACFNTARSVSDLDGRGMFIAVSECHQTGDYRTMRRKLRRKMINLQWNTDELYSVFKSQFNAVLAEFELLVNKRGESQALTEAVAVDNLLAKFQDEESGLSVDAMSKWTTIFTNMEMSLEDEDELTVESVHFRVELELDAHSMNQKPDNHRGRSQLQRKAEGRIANAGGRRCILCSSEEHMGRDCPRFQTKICRKFNSPGGCRFSEAACFYVHEKESGNGNTSKDGDNEAIKTGANATMQGHKSTNAGDAADAAVGSMRLQMAMEKEEYDAMQVEVGSMSQQTFNSMYQANQGQASNYYDSWAEGGVADK